LAVIGQAMARQTVAERADHPALSALGVRPREFVRLALLRTLLTGAAGAAGAVMIAVLASPLTPVGEARLAAVTAVSIWPAIRHARLLFLRMRRQPRSTQLRAIVLS